MSVLFGKAPKLSLVAASTSPARIEFDNSLALYLPKLTADERLRESISRVLRLPSVGSKAYLITIGDRSITGLVTRDQMVGPWQVPVADVAVTRASYGFDQLAGEAMALGERTPIALLNPGASAKMAVAEALTNLAAASIPNLGRVKLSANWMCAATHPGEGAGLYEAVKAIGMELCPALGIGIPVGKDSMSMSMGWKDAEGQAKKVTAPLSAIITAFSPVDDVSRTWTPALQMSSERSSLFFVDLACGKQRLGGSALAQVFRQIGSDSADVEDPALLKSFMTAAQALKSVPSDVVLAYHDRSDGGLLATLFEMSFAGRVGMAIDISNICQESEPISALFNEELGAVFQVSTTKESAFLHILDSVGIPSSAVHRIGRVNSDHEDQSINIISHDRVLFSSTRGELQQLWAETSFRMQVERDEPSGALEEFESILAPPSSSGLFFKSTAPLLSSTLFKGLERPRVAILRDQGVNGQIEMAWAFHSAGFEAIDVHMTDIISGTVSLSSFRGLAACGGFSYGDVLGAGAGWAKSVLFNIGAREQFSAFFARNDTFALGVCNGCQFLSQLREIIPGTDDWPLFKTNRSERFEGRVSLLKINSSSHSVFLRDMDGSVLPIAVAHGEGRAAFVDSAHLESLLSSQRVAAQYVDRFGAPTVQYPLNPNGSPEGIAAVESRNGRFLAIMPHPERVVTLDSQSWFPKADKDAEGRAPWFRLFQNARAWCAQ